MGKWREGNFKECTACKYREAHVEVSELSQGFDDIRQEVGGQKGNFINLGNDLFACPDCGTVKFIAGGSEKEEFTSNDIPY